VFHQLTTAYHISLSTCTYDCLAFAIAGPMIWNSLADKCSDLAHGFDRFSEFLKTILFSLGYCDQDIQHCALQKCTYYFLLTCFSTY